MPKDKAQAGKENKLNFDKLLKKAAEKPKPEKKGERGRK